MKAGQKWVFRSICLLIIFFAGYFSYSLLQLLNVGTAYKAKVLCSGIFVSKRAPAAVLSTDLQVDDLAVLRWIDTRIDQKAQTVTATFFGLATKKAIFRPGLGCTLELGPNKEKLRARILPCPVVHRFGQQNLLWPEGEQAQTDALLPEIAFNQLNKAVDEAFLEPDAVNLRRTRAVVVVYNGRIIAERYAPGFSHDTPLLGWSLTTSVINALTGILVSEDRLSLNDRNLITEWSTPGDPRGNITLDMLLRMTSGLRFNEDYTAPQKDVIQMLLNAGDVAKYAAQKPLTDTPGAKWNYSSGSTNIIAAILRKALGSNAAYLAFPRRALFDRIGMSTAVIEPDAAGTFVGSSFMYASARDWARFGLLYLTDGIWNKERILPEGWRLYSLTPTACSPRGEYGAHFWLKVPSFYTTTQSDEGALPPDTFHAVGHEGQFISIVPSKKLVVVRLGLTRAKGAWDHRLFLANLLATISSERKFEDGS